jgi:hypothetical protein
MAVAPLVSTQRAGGVVTLCVDEGGAAQDRHLDQAERAALDRSLKLIDPADGAHVVRLRYETPIQTFLPVGPAPLLIIVKEILQRARPCEALVRRDTGIRCRGRRDITHRTLLNGQ